MNIFSLFSKSKQAQSADPNYGVSMQLYTPGQPVYMDKNYLSFVKEGYRKNPTVYACINKIAGAASGIKWRLWADETKKREITSHDLLTLWKKPNPSMNGSGSLVEQIFGFWHMSGNSYVWAYRPTPDSPPLALWPLRPDRVKAVAGTVGIENYVYGYGSQNPQIYDKSDVMHLKFPAFDDDIYGLSPIEVASYYVDQINESMGWNTALMQNMGRPASVFMSKNYLNVEERNQIKEELKRKYSGKRNAGMPLILEADMTWTNMSLKPTELDWLESRERNSRDVASIFQVASELIGDSQNKTYANMAEARQGLYTENVLPKMDRFRDYLNAWLVPMWPDLADSGYIDYDVEDIEALSVIIQAQKKAIADRARQDWLDGGITLDEYREAIGKPKAKYGAIYRIGAILVSEDSLEDYADQSLTEPAVPPAALPEPLNVVDADPNNPTPAIPPAKQPAQIPPPKAGKKSLDKNDVYQPDDLQAQLKKLKAQGVTRVMWVCGKSVCDICVQNQGIIREVGQAFPSGHILPQCHPNCDCTIEAVPEGFEKMQVLFIRYLAERSNKSVELFNVSSKSIPMDQGNSDSSGLHLRMPVVQAQGNEGKRADRDQRQSHYEDKITSREAYRAFMEAYT